MRRRKLALLTSVLVMATALALSLRLPGPTVRGQIRARREGVPSAASRLKGAHYWLLVSALDLALILFIAWQVWSKPFPLLAYLAAVALLGLMTAALLRAGSASRILVLAHVVAIAFLLRGAYFLSTHFSVFPQGDAYGVYGVLQAFLSEDKAFLVDKGGFIDQQIYSGWPGIQLLSIAIVRVTGISSFNLALFLPWAFFSLWIAMSFVLVKRLVEDLNLPEFTIPVALMILAAFPSVAVPEFKHQYMAWALFATILYFLYRQLRQPSGANCAGLLVLILALTITHHYTSLIATICLLALAAVMVVARLALPKSWEAAAALPPRFIFFVLGLGAIGVIALLAWWSTYAAPGGTLISWGLEGFAESLQTGLFKPWTYAFEFTTTIPSVLKPAWGSPVLLSRDSIVVVSAIVGYAWLVLRAPRPSATVSFISFLLLIVASLGVADIFVTKQAPYRVFWYFAPFAGLLVAVAYTLGRKQWPVGFSIAGAGATTIIIFASFTGLWAHFYVPAHLYDPSVSAEAAGEHPLGWRRIREFCERHSCYDGADKVLTDEIYALLLTTPPGDWSKATVVGFEGAELSDKSVVVLFRDLDARTSYINQGDLWELDPGYSEAHFRQQLDQNSSLIFDDGSYKVWSGSRSTRPLSARTGLSGSLVSPHQ